MTQSGGVTAPVFYHILHDDGQESTTYFPADIDSAHHQVLPNVYAVCLSVHRLGRKVVAGLFIKSNLSYEGPGFVDVVNEIIRNTPELNVFEGMAISLFPLPESKVQGIMAGKDTPKNTTTD
jgi:hypothetical protein